MDNITYQEQFLVKSSEVNSKQELSLSGLLKIFQNLAVSGSTCVGAGKDKTLDKGYLWVFSKLEIDIYRMPKYLETINLITYPNEIMHYIYPRTFIIKDLNDNVLVEGKSIWCLINENTRKIALPKETGITYNSCYKAKRISNIEIKDIKLLEKREVKYTDIDLNKHLNNTKYLDYILDLYPSTFYQNNNFKRINMVFHQEVKEGDLLEIWGSIDNSYYQFRLGDNKVFECNIEY